MKLLFLNALSSRIKAGLKGQIKFFAWRIFLLGIIGGAVGFFALGFLTLLVYLIFK